MYLKMLRFHLREHTKLPEQIMRDLVLLKLEAVGLRGARKLMPSQLSGGMARRVASSAGNCVGSLNDYV